MSYLVALERRNVLSSEMQPPQFPILIEVNFIMGCSYSLRFGTVILVILTSPLKMG